MSIVISDTIVSKDTVQIYMKQFKKENAFSKFTKGIISTFFKESMIQMIKLLVVVFIQLMKHI